MTALPPAGLIVAMTPSGLIGRDGDLPWHHKEDLRHFKRSTLGGSLVMGRKSFESLGSALPGRANVVVSRSVEAGPDGRERDGARWFGDLSDACAWSARHVDGLTWIAGGAEIYRAVLAPLDGQLDGSGLPRPDPLVITWVPEIEHREGDVVFPFDADWIARHYDVMDERDGETDGLRFVTYGLRDRS